MYKRETQKARRKGSGVSGVRKKRVERQEDKGEYTQKWEERVIWKKVEGLLGKDGLLYHGEAETIAAVPAPAEVLASSRGGTIKAQSEHCLRLRREMPL
ncbi:hypothetical protein O181_088005 [Austropuccinia psidii MF-1]|uniref:Uncharacterized protein n=1 Tax=Austropuccinia psidii MF-1 TaxID=1389203 RepID=A0A9Q3IQZ6_9BASI|nr:hypothetical protein [Austropuccinia psidii MF-1]